MPDEQLPTPSPPSASAIIFPPSWYTGRRAVNVREAKSIPTIARCISLISGLAKQIEMYAQRGDERLPPDRLLQQPDPTQGRSWFVESAIWDYMLHGNSICYVTSYYATGYPASVVYVPVSWVNIMWDQTKPYEKRYLIQGMEVPAERIIHVKRRIDPYNPNRGIGVVEQHLTSLSTQLLQIDYENNILDGSAVPSVVITSPTADVSSEAIRRAQETWEEKYGGPVRRPAVLPNGTSVEKLSWSPTDSQMVEARQMSLTDAANICNVDAMWVNAPTSSHTYRTDSSKYLNLLRQSVNPILVDFEQTWGQAWLPMGQQLKFDRRAVLTDSMASDMTTMVAGVKAGLFSVEEARIYLGFPPEPTVGELEGSNDIPEQLQDYVGNNDDEDGEDTEDDDENATD